MHELMYVYIKLQIGFTWRELNTSHILTFLGVFKNGFLFKKKFLEIYRIYVYLYTLVINFLKVKKSIRNQFGQLI